MIHSFISLFFLSSRVTGTFSPSPTLHIQRLLSANYYHADLCFELPHSHFPFWEEHLQSPLGNHSSSKVSPGGSSLFLATGPNLVNQHSLSSPFLTTVTGSGWALDPTLRLLLELQEKKKISLLTGLLTVKVMPCKPGATRSARLLGHTGREEKTRRQSLPLEFSDTSVKKLSFLP